MWKRVPLETSLHAASSVQRSHSCAMQKACAHCAEVLLIDAGHLVKGYLLRPPPCSMQSCTGPREIVQGACALDWLQTLHPRLHAFQACNAHMFICFLSPKDKPDIQAA